MTDSGIDEAVGVLEVCKHQLGMITSDLKDSQVDDRWNARFNMVLSSDFLYLYRHGFGGEEVGRYSLVSDKH